MLSATCVIRIRTQTDINSNVHRSSSKAPAILLDFNETLISEPDFPKYKI
jgi:predicted secreted acid phosphatase